MGLTEEQMIWIETAIDKGFTRLQIIKKLQSSDYQEELIQAMIDYYDENATEVIPKTEKKVKRQEKDFEKQVKTFIKEPEKLSWGERRQVKKFMKNCEKFNKALKAFIKGINMELAEINKKFEGKTEKVKAELEKVRIELIDRIMDTRDIFSLEHPYKDTPIESKEDLMDVKLDDLILLLEENIDELNLVINGKI